MVKTCRKLQQIEVSAEVAETNEMLSSSGGDASISAGVIKGSSKGHLRVVVSMTLITSSAFLSSECKLHK